MLERILRYQCDFDSEYRVSRIEDVTDNFSVNLYVVPQLEVVNELQHVQALNVMDRN